MVVFIVAAAAAFLLCILLRSSKQARDWLDEDAHAFQLILFLSVFAAALVTLILIVASASTFGVMIFLFSLPIGFVIWGRRSLLIALAYQQPREGQQPREWQHNVLRWFVVISPLLPGVLLGRDLIVPLVPDVIVSWVDVTVSWVSKQLGSVLPDSAVVAICAWLVPAAVLAIGLAVKRLRERWQTWLVFGSLLLTAIFSALTAGHAWAVPAVVAICAWLVAAAVLATGLANNWLRKQWQTWLVFSSLVLIAIFSTLTAEEGDAWAYAILLTIHRIASMRETTYAVLGAVAGLMCGNFPWWINYARTHVIGPTGGGAKPVKPKRNPGEEEASAGKPASGLWPVIIFCGALACVVLAAVLAHYEQTALSRLSGVETPYLKLQFAISPSSAEQNLNVARDLNQTDSLDEYPRNHRYIQYDCAQAALDAHKNMHDFIESEDARTFIAGLAFRQSVIPYVNRVLNAQRKDYNPIVLKARTRQVAEKFALLTTNRDFEKNYLAAMSEIDRQVQLFSDEQVGPDPAPQELDRRSKEPDPDYCLPAGAEAELALPKPGAEAELALHRPNARDVNRVVQQKPRYIFSFAAALFLFEGNLEAANAMTNSAFRLNEQTEDINLLAGRADALYLGGQDLREVIPLLQKSLQLIESRLAQAERATDNKIRSDLVRRYRRARFIDRLDLAYILAQHGLGAEEDLLPQRDLNWWSAQKYANDAYETLLDPNKSPPRFECIDHDLDLRIKDKYAFVKLAYQAYNLKTQRGIPDEFQVRQARGILEGALAEAREEHRRLEEAKAQGKAASSCYTELETRAWIKQISSHLKLADALRP